MMYGRPFDQTGIIKRNKILKEYRHMLRDQTTKYGRWSKIKSALDAVQLGERDDIVMVRELGNKIVELAVIIYRERPGATAKVKISPILTVRLPQETEEVVSIWSHCIVEVTARLAELHSAVTASGGDGVEILVEGQDNLKSELVDAIQTMIAVTTGVPVKLNGEPVASSAISEHELWPTDKGPPPSAFIGALLKWNINQADEPFAKERALLSLATDDAGVSRLSEAARVAMIPFYKDQDRDAGEELCTIRGTRDISEVEPGLVGSDMSNVLQIAIGSMAEAARRHQASIFTVWTHDQRLVGFASAAKLVGILKCDATHWHLGLEYSMLFFTSGRPDEEAMAELVGYSIGSQLGADIEELVRSALLNTDSVTLDVLVWTTTDRENNATDTLLDQIEDVLDEISDNLPAKAQLGEILVKKMDRAMARKTFRR